MYLIVLGMCLYTDTFVSVLVRVSFILLPQRNHNSFQYVNLSFSVFILIWVQEPESWVTVQFGVSILSRGLTYF